MHSFRPLSRRALLLGGTAALTGGVAGVWRRADSAGATRPDAAAGITGIAAPATATQPADRIRRSGKPLFPMDPSPRCEVLDNFGESRSGGRTHEGCDILATEGQAAYAVVDGTLSRQTVDGESGTSLSGNSWRLTANDGTRTFYMYAHLSGFAPTLQLGSKVLQGDIIGYVGDTGNPGSGNFHLHFEVHPNGGVAINPLTVLEIPTACTVW